MGSLAEAITKAENEQASPADPAVALSEDISVDEVVDDASSPGADAAEASSEPSGPDLPSDPDSGAAEDVAQGDVEAATTADSSDELAAVITDIEAQLSEDTLDGDESTVADGPPVESASDPEPEAEPAESGDAEPAQDAVETPLDEADTPDLDAFAPTDEIESDLAETPAEPDETLDPALPDAESLISVPTYQEPLLDPADDAVPPVPAPAQTPTAAPAATGGLAAESTWELVQDQELTEQYRGIRRELMARLPRDHALVVAVVGVGEPAGADAARALNSVAALNLGSVIAEIKGTAAAVVDANFTGRCITDLLRLQDAPGLADVVSGSERIENVIHSELVGHVDIIPVGSVDGHSPSDLLGSDRAGVVFGELRRQYDVVLVDAPSCPAPTLIDHFPSLFTGVLLVTETGKADQQRAKALVSRFEERGVTVIGCILATADEG